MSEDDGQRAEFDALIAHHFPGGRLTGIQRFTGGVSADVFCLDLLTPKAGPARYVLRVHGATHGGHDAALEHELLGALRDAGSKVPTPLGYGTGGGCLPDPYLVIEYIEGKSAIPPDQSRVYIERMATELAGIHALAIDTLPALPVRIDPRPEVFEFLPPGEEWGPLTDTFEALPETAWQGEQVLLHGDFWPENLLWRDGDIVAVLDWEDAAIGDPMADLAGACVELRYLFGPDVMAGFTAAYARHRAIDEFRLALWQVYVAAAAQQYMVDWRLPPAREAHMRKEALASIREAAAVLAAAGDSG